VEAMTPCAVHSPKTVYWWVL